MRCSRRGLTWCAAAESRSFGRSMAWSRCWATVAARTWTAAPSRTTKGCPPRQVSGWRVSTSLTTGFCFTAAANASSVAVDDAACSSRARFTSGPMGSAGGAARRQATTQPSGLRSTLRRLPRREAPWRRTCRPTRTPADAARRRPLPSSERPLGTLIGLVSVLLTGTAVGDPSPSHRSVPSRVVTGRGLGTVTGG